ncbi:MAG: hypothetical protein OET90_06410 [Desulfuromonadales bacterium]|nr:hypothetical protein [Desulfuromonadales bacterium]
MTGSTQNHLIRTLLILAIWASSCFADHEQSQQEQEPDFMDETHEMISEQITAPSIWFDEFFQDQRTDDEPAGTLVRLRGSMIVEEGEGVDFDGNIKARLKLPNLKRRFHLIFTSEDDELGSKTVKDARIDEELGESKSNTLALQYTQKRTAKVNVSHRVRVETDGGLNPQVRSRVRYRKPLTEQTVLTLEQAVFWEDEDGFGAESRFDFDYLLDDKELIRTSARGVMSEESDGLEWAARLQWLKSFSHKRAVSVAAYTVGETEPKSEVTEYGTFVKYRQRIYKEWLFVEVKPEVNWQRKNDFNSSGKMTLTLEIQFGK